MGFFQLGFFRGCSSRCFSNAGEAQLAVCSRISAHDGGFAPAVLQTGACKDSLELEM